MKPYWNRYGELVGFVGTALAGVVLGFVLGIYCDRPPETRHPAAKNLTRQVAQALNGDERAAGQYAAFYNLLADRFEADAYETTTRAAQVAGRAAEILQLPGYLKEIVGKELNPHLGTPGPLSAQQSEAAAKSLRELANACQAAAR